MEIFALLISWLDYTLIVPFKVPPDPLNEIQTFRTTPLVNNTGDNKDKINGDCVSKTIQHQIKRLYTLRKC